MPSAPMVRNMKSLSVLTPFYAEDVMYSNSDLLKQNQDGLSNLYIYFVLVFLLRQYLQTIYPRDWQNFSERVGLGDIPKSLALQSDHNLAVRLWATNRGQTLARTCQGMMLYRKALNVLAGLEEPTEDQSKLADMCQQKFTYVIACQVYGQQKKNEDV